MHDINNSPENLYNLPRLWFQEDFITVNLCRNTAKMSRKSRKASSAKGLKWTSSTPHRPGATGPERLHLTCCSGGPGRAAAHSGPPNLGCGEHPQAESKALLRVVEAAERILRVDRPSMAHLRPKGCKNRALDFQEPHHLDRTLLRPKYGERRLLLSMLLF